MDLSLVDGSCASRIRIIIIYLLTKLIRMFELSQIEKILLVRAHKVGAWLDEHFNPMPTLEDLVTIGRSDTTKVGLSLASFTGIGRSARVE